MLQRVNIRIYFVHDLYKIYLVSVDAIEIEPFLIYIFTCDGMFAQW